jgi:signal transduction histidine kinase
MQSALEPAPHTYGRARSRSSGVAWIARLAGLTLLYFVIAKVGTTFASLRVRWRDRRDLARAEAMARLERRLELEAEAHGRLEAEVAAAVENERLRLGTELHEGLGQELTGIAYLMAALHRTLRGADSEQAGAAMRLEDMITRAIERTRVLAKAFYPMEMATLGLVVSLEEMAYNATRSLDVQCRVRADLDAGASNLRGSMAIQLFRIAEEAIYFEAKQGHARRIEISVAVDDGDFVLTVAGDGDGVSSELEEVESTGLRMMRYRAGVIGGRLDVRSPIAGGTWVRCSVPFLTGRELATN